MYRIGEFSKIAKITIKTLRYYDETGLLKPAFVDKENSYRYYTTTQLLPLHQIVVLRQAGLTIEEVKLVLSEKNAAYILEKRKKELESEIQNTKKQLSHINSILLTNKEDFFMDYQAAIIEIPEHTIFCKKGVVPTFADLGNFIVGAMKEFETSNPDIKYVQPDFCYITYIDPEFKTENAAVEYAQAVTAIGKETDTIKFKKVSPVTAVSVYHKGEYEGLSKAYAFAYSWIEKNGYTPIERPREHYIDGTWNNKAPEDWLTEIQIPIAKK